MPRMDESAYDRLVFDNARDFGAEVHRLRTAHAGHEDRLDTALRALVAMACGTYQLPIELTEAVIEASTNRFYAASHYRGQIADERVIETIKNILRVVHHDEIYPKSPLTGGPRIG